MGRLKNDQGQLFYVVTRFPKITWCGIDTTLDLSGLHRELTPKAEIADELAQAYANDGRDIPAGLDEFIVDTARVRAIALAPARLSFSKLRVI